MRDSLLLVHGSPGSAVHTKEFSVLRTEKLDTAAARGASAFLIHGRDSGDSGGALRMVLDSMFVSVLKQRVRLFDYSVLKDVVFAEGHRIARYKKSQSSLIILNFEGIEHIYVELGKRARELFEELTMAFVAILRESDLLSSRNESLFLALLMETPTTAAERAVERLREGVDQLLRSNLKHPPTMNISILRVTEKTDVDAAIAELVGSEDARDAARGGVDVP